jgi:hypothetical protein
MRRWTTDSVHEGGSCTFTVIMKRRHDLFLLFGRDDTRCFLLEFWLDFFFFRGDRTE